MSPVVDVVRTYLELRSPRQLRPATLNDPDVRFVRREAMSVDHYRRLYHDVGARWHWRDRDAWSDARLAAHLGQPAVRIWECMAGEASAGFFELERHVDGSVEIAYFGLVMEFAGRGIGKAMLTQAVREAWALAPTHVWLHTCTLDSPSALANYISRGFTRARTETFVVQLPEAGE